MKYWLLSSPKVKTVSRNTSPDFHIFQYQGILEILLFLFLPWKMLLKCVCQWKKTKPDHGFFYQNALSQARQWQMMLWSLVPPSSALTCSYPGIHPNPRGSAVLEPSLPGVC